MVMSCLAFLLGFSMSQRKYIKNKRRDPCEIYSSCYNKQNKEALFTVFQVP